MRQRKTQKCEINKTLFRSQFVIWIYGWSNGIVRCCKEVHAMPITNQKHNINYKQNCRIPGNDLRGAAVVFYNGGVKG